MEAVISRNGSGTYTLPQPPFTPGTTIASSAVNSDLSDIAAALTQSISKDGQTVYTGNQPMGGNKLTGLGAGTALTDSVRLGQVSDGSINYGGVAGGTADALTLSPVPGITAYAKGQTFTFAAAADNTGAVTVNVSAVGAGALTWPDGTAMAAGDLQEDGIYEIAVADVTPIFHLQNVSAPPLPRTGGTMSGTLAMSGAAINEAKGADIASATTTNIGAATGNYVNVTGTTTITGLGTVQAGTERTVTFTGALTLTHNATSLILPGGANILTAAGDSALFRSLGSGNWKCITYTRNAYTPGGGQIVTLLSGAVDTTASAIPIDDTKPQSGEGKEIMSLAITPKSATSKLYVDVTIIGAVDTATAFYVASLFQDSGADALATAISNSAFIGGMGTMTFSYSMTSGTTSATTFKVRAGPSSGTFTFNGAGGARYFGGASASSITIHEVI
jgi:hypothetical protein